MPSIGVQSSRSLLSWPAVVALAMGLFAGLPGNTRAQTVDIVHEFQKPPDDSRGELCEWNGVLYGTTLNGGDHDEGTVFEITPGGALTVLHSFGGPTGSGKGRLPWGGVACVDDGSGGLVLYGTAWVGGANDLGTIFRLVPGGAVELMHSFNGSTLGGRPQINLTQASDGYLYGATSSGSTGRGSLFRFLPSPVGIALQALHSFPVDFAIGEVVEGPDALYVPTFRPVAGSVRGVIYRISKDAIPSVTPFIEIVSNGPDGFLGDPRGLVATSRALYLTTRSGSFGFDGAILRIPFDVPSVQVVHFFDQDTTGRSAEAALAKESETVFPMSTTTSFLGTTIEGGANGLGTAFRLVVEEFDDGTATSSFQLLDSLERYEEGRTPLSTLVRGPAGAFYGTTTSFQVGDQGGVYRLTASGLESVHAFGVPQPGLVGHSPVGLAWGDDDRVYGVTWEGGDVGEGTAYSFDPSAPAAPALIAPVPGQADNNIFSYELRAGQPVLAPDGYFYTTTRFGGDENQGAIVRFALGSAAMETVYSFLVADSTGVSPQELALGVDGRLYGTTASGSSVYAFDPSSGLVEVLWNFSFANRPDGITPSGTLVVEGDCGGASCAVYGVTNVGGIANHGIVYRVVWDGASWTQEVLHRFVGSDGSRPLGGLILASDGLLYGTTNGDNASSGGGLKRVGSVFRMSTDGSTFEALHSFTGNDDGCAPSATLAEAGDGWVYGTAAGGFFCQQMPGWWGSLFRVEIATGAFEVLHTFDRWNGATPRGALLPASNGLLGTTWAGGPKGGGVLFAIRLPQVDPGGPYSVDEGGTVGLLATADPAGASFEWDLDDDGAFDDGVGASVDFSAAGLDGPDTRTVRVRAVYPSGGSVEGSTTVEILNVAPSVDAGGDVSLNVGETLVRTGQFVDPGPDQWTGTVDWGQGSGPEPLALTGTSFDLSHPYPAPGSFQVVVEITDDDGGVGTSFFQVTVVSVRDSIEDLIDDVQDLIDEDELNRFLGRSLIRRLRSALFWLDRGDVDRAVFQLRVFVFQAQLYVGFGLLDPAEGQSLIDDAGGIITALGG